MTYDNRKGKGSSRREIIDSVTALLGLLFPTLAFGANFTVNSTLDIVDGTPGDGLCATVVSGQCTLRAAIQEANVLPGDDTITLPAGSYVLTLNGAGEDNTVSGDLDIRGPDALVLRGAAADSTIVDGNQLDRVFHILANAGAVTIDKVTIRNGRLAGNGAGVYNAGANTVINATEISDNLAATILDTSAVPARTIYGVGGGIFNDSNASLVIDNVTVAYNNATAVEFYDTGSLTFSGGGGIRNLGTLDIRNNSRIENNVGKQGGGINNTGTVDIGDSVIEFNKSVNAAGGGILNWGGILHMHRSVVSDNDCGITCDGGGLANHPGANENGSIPAIAVIIESAIDNNLARLNIGAGVSNFSNMYIGYSSVSWNDGQGPGAGISNSGEGDLTIENSSIVGNFQYALPGPGAGIHSSRTLRLNHVTLTGNFTSAGGIADDLYINTREFDAADPKKWITIKNSIIGDDSYRQSLIGLPGIVSSLTPNYCGGGYSESTGIPTGALLVDDNIATNEYLSLIHSEGYNISNGPSCALTGPGDLADTAPQLLDAGDYGGTPLPIGPFLPHVLTRPPAATSPTRDVVPLASCAIRFDQRLLGRPSAAACDTGAVEADAVTVPYADLSISATSEPKYLASLNQTLLYKVVITNRGPNDVTGLSGSAEPVSGIGQPTEPVVMSSFKLQGLKLGNVSFTAPPPIGVVSCSVTANAADENVANCGYNRPLPAGSQLILYITLIPAGFGWNLSTTASVSASSPPDPVDYNNRVTLTHLIGGNSAISGAPPIGTEPVSNSGGAMNTIDLLLFVTALWLKRAHRVRVSRARSARTSRLCWMLGLAALTFSGTSNALSPTVTSVTPNTGSATTDTVITIQGTDFDPNVRVALLNDPGVRAVAATLSPVDAYFVLKRNQFIYLGTSFGASASDRISIHDVTNPVAAISVVSALVPGPNRAAVGTTPRPQQLHSYTVGPDNKLYVAYSGRLAIHDLTDPATPALQHYFPVLTRTNGLHPDLTDITDMAVDGNLLYMVKNYKGSYSIGNQSGLYVIDTTKTTGANIIGFYRLGTPRIKLVSVPTSAGIRKFAVLAGATTTVTVGSTPQDGSMVVLEITDPTNPVAVGVYKGPWKASVGANDTIFDVDIKVVATGTVTKVYAVVATYNPSPLGVGGLAIYDVGPDTAFAILDPVGSYFGFNGRLIKLDGDMAIMNDNSGRIFWQFDIADLTAPKLTGGPYALNDTTDYYPWHMDAADGYIYSTANIIKTNPPLTITNVTPTSITATVPAGYRPQLYDLVVTNPLGQAEEVRFLDSFSVP